MLRVVLLAGALTILAWGTAPAAELSAADYGILSADYGLDQDSAIIRDMTTDERSSLHEIMNDPHFDQFPHARSVNAGDYLYKVHIRECQAWRESHASAGMCPLPAIEPPMSGRTSRNGNVISAICSAPPARHRSVASRDVAA